MTLVHLADWRKTVICRIYSSLLPTSLPHLLPGQEMLQSGFRPLNHRQQQWGGRHSCSSKQIWWFILSNVLWQRTFWSSYIPPMSYSLFFFFSQTLYLSASKRWNSLEWWRSSVAPLLVLPGSWSWRNPLFSSTFPTYCFPKKL